MVKKGVADDIDNGGKPVEPVTIPFDSYSGYSRFDGKKPVLTKGFTVPLHAGWGLGSHPQGHVIGNCERHSRGAALLQISYFTITS
jgi:hypothetical protein